MSANSTPYQEFPTSDGVSVTEAPRRSPSPPFLLPAFPNRPGSLTPSSTRKSINSQTEMLVSDRNMKEADGPFIPSITSRSLIFSRNLNSPQNSNNFSANPFKKIVIPKSVSFKKPKKQKSGNTEFTFAPHLSHRNSASNSVFKPILYTLSRSSKPRFSTSTFYVKHDIKDDPLPVISKSNNHIDILRGERRQIRGVTPDVSFLLDNNASVVYSSDNDFTSQLSSQAQSQVFPSELLDPALTDSNAYPQSFLNINHSNVPPARPINPTSLTPVNVSHIPTLSLEAIHPSLPLPSSLPSSDLAPLAHHPLSTQSLQASHSLPVTPLPPPSSSSSPTPPNPPTPLPMTSSSSSSSHPSPIYPRPLSAGPVPSTLIPAQTSSSSLPSPTPSFNINTPSHNHSVFDFSITSATLHHFSGL